MPLNAEDSARAVALVEDGRSFRYVAEVLGTSSTSVYRAVKRFREFGTYHRKPGSGRPRRTTARDDRFLTLHVLRNRHTTALQARNVLRQTRQVNVSENTVRRRLKEVNLLARRPANGPELKPEHRRTRLQFARDHLHWTGDDWSRVLFSDESRFNLRFPDGRKRVYRRRGERYASCTFSGRTPYGGGSIMVWGGVNSEARTDLVFIEHGTLTAPRYIEEVLNDHVLPFAPFIGEHFLFMQDNARPHTAECVTDYLQRVGIQTLQWPARSPDLNPIEHVWDAIGRSVRQQNYDTLPELRAALLEEWNNDDIQDKIRRKIASMPRRMQAVINAGGGNTRY